MIALKEKIKVYGAKESRRCICLDSDITQQEYVHKTLSIELACQGKGFEICFVDSLFPAAVPFFHLSVFIRK